MSWRRVHRLLQLQDGSGINGKAVWLVKQHSCMPGACKQVGCFRGGPLKPLPILLPSRYCSIHAGRGVVVALGAWSGAFLADQMADVRWAAAFRPRRGLLLEMPRPGSMPPVQHGMMEVGYTQV